jgi:hypothetical protein
LAKSSFRVKHLLGCGEMKRCGAVFTDERHIRQLTHEFLLMISDV